MTRLAVFIAFSCHLCLFFGCKDDTIVISASIKRVDGQSLLGLDPAWESALISLQQDDQPVVERRLEPVDETLRLRLPVSRNLSTRLQVELSRGDERLIGSLPIFYAGWAPLGLRVLLAEPSRCVVFEELELAVPRQNAGFAKVGATALVLGGEPEGQSSVAEFIDLLSMRRWDYIDDLGEALGACQIAAVDDRYALVVPEKGDPFVYDLATPARIDSTIAIDSVDLGQATSTIVFESTEGVELLGNLGQGPSNGVQLCFPEQLVF
ncbi:MAG: hypothetical protein IPJ88_01665 [Myxococcales bacterium]|nr:MAG: hypothetical protein IPJ88_01665 [Myxococcales bacterium]